MSTHKLAGKNTASERSTTKLILSEYDPIKLLGKQVVLFAFYDEVTEQEYKNDFGLILTRELSKNKARWGVCIKSTPDSSVKPGEFFLPLKVTEEYGANWNGLELWRCTDDDIQLVTPDEGVIEKYEDA